TFVASDIAGNNSHVILTKTISGGSMSIPGNSWSPNNKQVFVAQNGSDGTTYYVLHADGTLFASGDASLDIKALWQEKKMQYTIRDATGWAAYNLVIVYTSKDDGTPGPAFWFVTDTKGFLQL